MIKINAVIVVEGKSDIDYLSSFITAEFISVNGSAVSRETLELIKHAARTHRVIVLTDPDGPGEKIRKIIKAEVPNAYDAFIDKKYAVKGHKVGVAECDKKEIIRALEAMMYFDPVAIKSDLDILALLKFNLIGASSKELRERICRYYKFSMCNGKTLLKRLRMLGVKVEDIERILGDHYEC